MTNDDHGRGNALAWFESIMEMTEPFMTGFANAGGMDDADADDAARERIQESALSVEVRSRWYVPGEREEAPAEYRILLTTGGPALQMIGELNEHGEPESAWLEYQDWGTPWTRLDLRRMAEIVDPRIVATKRKGEAPIEMRLAADDKAKEMLLAFARCFYFGEG